MSEVLAQESESDEQRRLTISVPSIEVDNKVNSKLREFAKTVRLKGFRPGRVPVSVVKRNFGASIRQEVVAELTETAYKKALDEVSIKPIMAPVIEFTRNQPGENLEFVASVEVLPEVPLEGLDAVKVIRKTVLVTDVDIDKAIEQLPENSRPDSEQIETFKDALREGLESRCKKLSEEMARKDLFDQLIEMNPFQVSENLKRLQIEQKKQELIQQFGDKMSPVLNQKISLSNPKLAAMAERDAKISVIVNQMLKEVDLNSITQEDRESKVQRMVMDHAAQSSFAPMDHNHLKQLEAAYLNDPNLALSVDGLILEDKAIELLFSKVNVANEEISYDQAQSLQKGFVDQSSEESTED